MNMNLLGKPTDADLDKFPHVLLTGPHEWDPSVLDCTHPATDGDLSWAPAPSQCDAHDTMIDGFGHFKGRVHHSLTHAPGRFTMAHNKQAFKTQPIDFEKIRPYFGWFNNIPLRKPSTKPFNGLLPPLGIL